MTLRTRLRHRRSSRCTHPPSLFGAAAGTRLNKLRHQRGGAVRLLNRDLGIQSHASSAGELARVGEVPTYSIYSLLIITSYPGRELSTDRATHLSYVIRNCPLAGWQGHWVLCGPGLVKGLDRCHMPDAGSAFSPCAVFPYSGVNNGLIVLQPFVAYQILTNGDNFSKIKVGITEGKNRELRRFFGHFGLEVMDLKRFEFGGISLNNLPTGKSRYLTRDEYKDLRHFVNTTEVYKSENNYSDND